MIVPELQDSAYALIDTLFADSSPVNSSNNGIKRLNKVFGNENDVCASLNTTYGSLSIGVLFHDGPHLHGISDDDVLIAQFTAQFVLQND